jgi:small subunit ribosomal protein S1
MTEYSLGSLASFVNKAQQRLSKDTASREPGHEERDNPFERQPTGLPMPGIELDPAWNEARRLYDDGRSVTAIVMGWNRGGLLVRWNTLQGFVPVSQLREIPELRLRVIELDQSRNRLVFSERATLWGPKDGDRVLKEIEVGQVRRGIVSNLCDFGAFLDLGGVDGLIHISELSWGRVIHPRELLSLGQEVETYVLNVDRENRRIGLSLKRLQPNPWTIVEREYQVGQVIPATISNIVDFGAFAQIEQGLEGLVHISELSDAPVRHPSEVVRVGDRVMVRILRIDSRTHRLGLSMRQVEPTDSAPSTEPEQAGWGGGQAYLY